MSKKEKKNEEDGTAQNQEIRTIINNDKNTEAALKQEIKSLNKKIELLSKLLAEKDRLVHQLSNEDRRFQQHYDLLATKVVQKGTIISTLEGLNTRMEVFEKSTATKNVSYSQIAASKASPNKETRSLKSIIITPDQDQ
ncbi:unnamed protein product [Acanthoscelides obtectus]|uniref:Uncharacterized protein n=1 Tax=Acanthoscelides obtectus TaxID=200917 RepID=A0A9P0NVW5_ACAOB|nr:unnamed protein product [Acanthoscelides obtectus]CAK1678895.1 hypothetical protein AOBTE_LOCUS32062 [Acanthoscelides obtectus]